MRILGWLITGFAISFGAPFWFDLLNRMMVVRSTVKPDEKSPEESSKDSRSGNDKSKSQPASTVVVAAGSCRLADDDAFRGRCGDRRRR